MLDFFYILTKGGLILWCLPSVTSEFIKIVNHAIDKAVLQGTRTWISTVSPHKIHYKLDNEYKLIFIVGYRKTLNISYADKFLDEIQKRFRDQYKNDLAIGDFNRSFPFRVSYEEILSEIEKEDQPIKHLSDTNDENWRREPVAVEKNDENKNKKPKQVVTTGKTRTKSKKVLVPPKTNENDQQRVTLSNIAPRPKRGDPQAMIVASSTNQSGLIDTFWSKLKIVNVFASKTLTTEDLIAGMDTMREHLIAKNVASDVAEKICESVSNKLAGNTLGTFESLTNNIRQAIHDTLVMILTPKRRIDILRDIVDAQQAQRPYVITFCGVNGVGKSTNLAKVAYWLGGNDLRVLIAGCDTFRSGAIEQLRTHVCHLNDIFKEKNRPLIELYERGYDKDPAGVARQAIHFAKDKKFDVVLIDTAGRMQNNKPLMTALAKLIDVNNPDLVLFVGEALVGNDAVDQITKFNQALVDNARLQSNPRLIDGIVLTKFDTVDDKVGAAISMIYTTDKPIVFVGTGQQYQDLKTINADVVTAALLK